MTQLIVLLLPLFVGLSSFAYGDCDSWLQAQAHARALTYEQIQEKQLERHWAETELSVRTLIDLGIISAKTCQNSAKEAIECVTLLDALARSGQPPYALIPLASLKDFKQEVLSVEKKIGYLALVRIKPDFQWGTGREYKETVTWINQRQLLTQNEIRKSFRKYEVDYLGLFDLIVNKVITRKREAAQVAAALNAVLALADSHARIQSIYELLDQDRSAGNSTWSGIGVSIFIVDGKLELDSVYARGPAARAGLQAGDQILSVNGSDYNDLTPSQLRERITGRAGSTVTLKVARYGEIGIFKIVREPTQIHNVEGRLLRPTKQLPVGHIVVRSFLNDQTCEDVKAQIESLEKRGAQRFVLNLSDNTGGSVSQAQCIAGLFVGKKLVARETNLETGMTKDIFAYTKKITDLPLVVLINAMSASASELLAGALRDHHRAWIMGEQSFGKGTMQYAFPFAAPGTADSSILVHRTAARFEQPSGTSNQRYGITPQFPVPQSPAYPDEPMPREEDMSPFSPAPLSKKWREDRPEEVQKLKNCLKNNGQADELYMLQRAAGKSVNYRLLSAIDLLNCMAAVNN